MGRLFAALTAFAALAGGAAHAADMPPAPGAAYTPVYRPHIYNWTGLYFGGHAGANLVFSTGTTTNATSLQPLGTAADTQPYGFLAGAQVGVNYQMGPWVLGVEATWSGSSASGTGSAPAPLPSIPPTTGSVRYTTATPWFATGTGRFGYAANNLLYYVKGGAAWMSVDYTGDVLDSIGRTVDTAQVSDNRIGWTVGAGLELGITEQLSAKIEYDYLDFGSSTYNLVYPIVGVTSAVAFKTQTHFFTVGLNYRFNWDAGGPIAVQY
jgi:opacity protein-like surface antigen